MTSCKWKQSNWKGKRLLSTFILYIYTIQSSSGSQALPRGGNVHFSLTTAQAQSNDGNLQVVFKTSNLPKKRRHARKYTSTYVSITAGTLPLGTAVAQWLRCCATNRKVAGSIPAGVSGFFIDIKKLPIALWPWGRLSL